MTATHEALLHSVTHATERLRAMSDADARRPRAPGTWSPKEIIGHLIDSASNNHRRFIQAQLRDELVFEGYEQADWVAAQHYRDAPWRDLVALWSSFNLHLARVIASVPEPIADRPRSPHNLHQVAWETPPADAPATLAFFMRDYVNHLNHHLRQIDVTLADPPTLQLGRGRFKSR